MIDNALLKLHNKPISKKDEIGLAKYYGRSPDIISPAEIQDYVIYLLNERKLRHFCTSKLTALMAIHSEKKRIAILIAEIVVAVCLRIFGFTARTFGFRITTNLLKVIL